MTNEFSRRDFLHLTKTFSATLPFIGTDFSILCDAPTSSVEANVRSIYLRGQEMGNNPDVIAKVGDSITQAHEYLWPIGEGHYVLYEYGYLQEVIDRFGYSFLRDSVAAQPGYTTVDILSPASGCPDPNRLICEYRIMRPSFAVIMIGTNDLASPIDDINGIINRLTTILDITVDHGIVPVLSTIPPSGLFDPTVYNGRIVQLAEWYQIPLIDYYSLMAELPDQGLVSDRIHPNVPPDGRVGYFDEEHLQYGSTVHNLSTLQALYKLLQILD